MAGLNRVSPLLRTKAVCTEAQCWQRLGRHIGLGRSPLLPPQGAVGALAGACHPPSLHQLGMSSIRVRCLHHGSWLLMWMEEEADETFFSSITSQWLDKIVEGGLHL